MLKNYLKIGFRNLIKNKVFTTINIVGLSIGISGCLLIFCYVNFELRYDQFHTKSDQIYRIASLENEGSKQGSALSPSLLGVELKRKYTEVKHATRMILPWSGQSATSTLGFPETTTSSSKQNFKWGFFVDQDFLEIFDFPLLQGNAKSALTATNQVILSESSAEKLFGVNWREKKVIGQNLEYVNEFDRFMLEITAVISDAPSDSHFDYDFLASFSTLNTGWGKDYIETWDGHSVYNYLELRENAEPELLRSHIQSILAVARPSDVEINSTFQLQALGDIHLKSSLANELKVNGKISKIYFLSILALLILVIAVGNYVNLTISVSFSRIKEVGVRKVMGALRKQLVGQFLIESVLIVIVSLGFAVLYLLLIQPFYYRFTGIPIVLSDPSLWLGIFTLIPAIIFLSGFYPALVISKLSPSASLKGQFNHSATGKLLRGGLIVFQFAASIILVDFTIVLLQQVQFMQSKDPGFSKEGVLVVKGPANRNETWIEHDKKPKVDLEVNDAFKDKLSQFSSISASSLSWSIPGESEHLSGIELGENYQKEKLDFLVADDDFSKVYDIQILAGDFSVKNGIVINQSAMKLLGFENPNDAIGESFRDNRQIEFRINGVIADYYHFGFKEKIQPLAFAENDPSYTLDSFYSLKVIQAGLEDTIAKIETAFAEVYPGDSFEYFFMDSHFEQQYLSEKSFSTVFGIFSVLSIFIACLGLFGLSMQSALERTKEIGIRKVLGAREVEIIVTLLKSTGIILGIAVLLAIPLSYFISSRWLENFAYKVDLTWGYFLVGSISILLLGIGTVSYQSLKVAFQNPVKSLKND